jgi:hypothetical protein
MKTAYYAGLQCIALALIFMPEPFTTPIGIGLLAYARKNIRQRPIGFRSLTNTFEDHYSYRMRLVNGTAINYQLSPRRQGQMPKLYPKIVRLQDNSQALRALRERSQRQSPQYTSTPFSKIEPAGLMKGPRIKDRAALATNRYTPTVK